MSIRSVNLRRPALSVLCFITSATLAACSGGNDNAPHAAVTKDKAAIQGGDTDDPGDDQDSTTGDDGPDAGDAPASGADDEPDSGVGAGPTGGPGSDAIGIDGTDPDPAAAAGGVDSDGDGFSDAMEEQQMTAEALGVDEPADPEHKDVYIYIDYYTAPDWNAVEDVKAAFEEGDVENPDGTTGITLHVIRGNQVKNPRDYFPDACEDDDGLRQAEWANFDTIKDGSFPAKWIPIAHYVLWADMMGPMDGSSGCSRGIPGHDLLVTLGGWKDRGTRLEQAGTLMHELGHNLGLRHGGNEDYNWKPNYLSVMNYMYQVDGLIVYGVRGVLDYSRFELDTVDESALDETVGMRPVPDTTTDVDALSGYGIRLAKAGLLQPLSVEVNGTCYDGDGLDFNDNKQIDCDLSSGPTCKPISVDLNGNRAANDVFIPSQDDWTLLSYSGGEGGTIGDVQTNTPIRYTTPITAHDLGPELDYNPGATSN